jgi:hypothetical protein
MNRGFLRWFYIGVQFVMLAVSIPKVATLFHAYDKEVMGPLIGGVDLRSWLVGIAIDLTATFTTWAAMAKYDESRKRTALLAPGLIILFCTALSVVANYEDAATQNPAQYAHINLFTQPALLINPVLISAPPVLVLLLILLVPSVLAQPRIRSAAEIAAEADEQEAKVFAEARIREAKARANARVRGAQIEGLASNASVVAKRIGLSKDEPEAHTIDTSADTIDTPPHAIELTADVSSHLFDPAASGIIEAPNGRASRAMWNSMSLRERVTRSGLITAQEIAEVLAISQAHARKLMAEIRASESDQPAVPGRKGVPYQTLIDALYTRRTSESFAQAQKLEKALGLRRRQRQGADNAEPTYPDHSGRTGATVEYRPDGGLGISTQAEDQERENWQDQAYSHNGHSRVRPAAD